VGIGRPEKVAMVLGRRVRRTTGIFGTRLFDTGAQVNMDFRYKHSRVKQYLKEGRALRIGTIINKPSDIGVKSRLEDMPEIVAKVRQVNPRLLMINVSVGPAPSALRSLRASTSPST
jgi:hypothetical protein